MRFFTLLLLFKFYYSLPALLSNEYCLLMSIAGAINVTVLLLSVLLVIVVLLLKFDTKEVL